MVRKLGVGVLAGRAPLAALLIAALLVVGRGHAGAAPAQSSGALYTLTMADNGTTLHMAVGDSVELRLDTGWNWNVSVSDPSVLHRPPVLLVQGVQGLWDAIAPGTATISATGTKVCQPGQACPALAVAFNATVVVSASSGTPNQTVSYQPGWSIVAGPPGTALPVDAYAWDPIAGAYTPVPAGTPLVAGRGYWAYFTTPTTVTLAATSRSSADVSAPAGAWVLVGNPSANATARVTGADVVYTWDPVAGRYQPTNALAPGAGGWALSAAGGTITVTTQ